MGKGGKWVKALLHLRGKLPRGERKTKLPKITFFINKKLIGTGSISYTGDLSVISLASISKKNFKQWANSGLEIILQKTNAGWVEIEWTMDLFPLAAFMSKLKSYSVHHRKELLKSGGFPLFLWNDFYYKWIWMSSDLILTSFSPTLIPYPSIHP